MRMATKIAEGGLSNTPTLESLPIEIFQKILKDFTLAEELQIARVSTKLRDAIQWRRGKIQTLYLIRPYTIYEDIYRGSPNDKIIVRLADEDWNEELGDTDDGLDFVKIEDDKIYICTDDPVIICDILWIFGPCIKKLIFRYYDDGEETDLVEVIAHYCYNIEVMQIDDMKTCDTEVFSSLFEFNEELHSIKSENSVALLEILPVRDWKSLRFTVPIEDAGSFCKSILPLIVNSKSLEEFGSNCWSPEIASAIFNCEELKILHFTQYWGNISIQLINDAAMLNRLTTLKIRIIEDDIYRVGDLLEECFNLRTLGLDYRDGFLPLAVIRTVLALPNLEAVALRCESLTDDHLRCLVNFKHLSIVGFSGSISDEGFLDMILMAEDLETLEIEHARLTPSMCKAIMMQNSERSKYFQIVVPEAIHNKACVLFRKSKFSVVKAPHYFE